MFARILIIAACKPDETDWYARFAYACSSQGHAVRIWCPPETRAEKGLEAVLAAFRPTVALWTAEARRHHAAEKLAQRIVRSCASGMLALRPEAALPGNIDFVMAVGERCRRLTERAAAQYPERTRPFVVGLPATVDAAYLRAKPSDPAAARDAITFDQACTPGNKALLDAAAGAAPGFETAAFHPSWPDGFAQAHPYANRSYRRRTAAFFIGAAGPDAPSDAELSLRAAEGAVAFIQRSDNVEAAEGSDSAIEPVFYQHAEGLAVELARLAADPAEAERIRKRQHEALLRMTPLEIAVNEALAAIDRGLKASPNTQAPERPFALSQREPTVKVVMYGWFGAQNFGDDLLLTSTAARIRKRFPSAEFHVIGANAAVIENEYGYQATTPDRKYEIRAFLERACAMVLCGGLLFDDPLAQTAGEMEFCMDPWIEPTGQAAICLLARSLGVPSVYLGFGAGPIDNRPTRIAVNLIGRSGARFLPRDAHTAALIEACGVSKEQIDVRADLVLGARDYVAEHAHESAEGGADEGFFTVSLRRWHRNPADFAQQIAAALDAITQETGLIAAMLPFDQDDVELHREVLSHMRRPEAARLIEQRPDEDELLSIVARSRFAFAMRLHCSILHHILGKPAVGLNYNDKIEAHFRRFGQQDMLVELDARSDAMVQAMRLTRSWEEDEEAREAFEQRRHEAAALVDKAFAELFAAIERTLPRPTGELVYFPRHASGAECRLHEQALLCRRRTDEAEAAQRALERENAALRDEIEALRASRSYRLGNAIVRIPHAIAVRLGMR